MAVALLRPACTVGSPEQPLYRALAAGKRPPLGGEGRLVQYLHVDDLATAVVHTCEQGLSGTFNVAPDSGVRAEVAGALAGGSAMLPLPAPLRAMTTACVGTCGGRARPRGPGPTPRTPGSSPGDKLRSTGWTPEYSSEQALVVSDERAHWSDLPPNRQTSAILAAAAMVAAVGAARSGGER